ncbi:MAG: hypothetical protein R3F37_20755 [Candidatus Competibacteraceae bacterium]
MAVLLPPIVVTLLLLWVLVPQLRDDLKPAAKALAHVIAGQIETYLLGAENELRALAEEFRYLGPQTASYWFGLLDVHAGTGDIFAAIYIADAEDSVYAVGLPEAQRDHLMILLRTRPLQASFPA